MTVDEAICQAIEAERARILQLIKGPLDTSGMRTGQTDPRAHYVTKRFIDMLCAAIVEGRTKL